MTYSFSKTEMLAGAKQYYWEKNKVKGLLVSGTISLIIIVAIFSWRGVFSKEFKTSGDQIFWSTMLVLYTFCVMPIIFFLIVRPFMMKKVSVTVKWQKVFLQQTIVNLTKQIEKSSEEIKYHENAISRIKSKTEMAKEDIELAKKILQQL